jgi:hypothetical protein
MTENTATVYRYSPKATAAVDGDPPRTVATTAPMPAPPVSTVRVVTGDDARAALSVGNTKLWLENPALQGVRAEERRIGRDVMAPAFREIADRTGFSKAMKAESRRIGLSRLLSGVWGSNEK